jgi:hypothetical protein
MCWFFEVFRMSINESEKKAHDSPKPGEDPEAQPPEAQDPHTKSETDSDLQSALSDLESMVAQDVDVNEIVLESGPKTIALNRPDVPLSDDDVRQDESAAANFDAEPIHQEDVQSASQEPVQAEEGSQDPSSLPDDGEQTRNDVLIESDDDEPVEFTESLAWGSPTDLPTSSYENAGRTLRLDPNVAKLPLTESQSEVTFTDSAVLDPSFNTPPGDVKPDVQDTKQIEMQFDRSRSESGVFEDTSATPKGSSYFDDPLQAIAGILDNTTSQSEKREAEPQFTQEVTNGAEPSGANLEEGVLGTVPDSETHRYHKVLDMPAALETLVSRRTTEAMGNSLNLLSAPTDSSTLSLESQVEGSPASPFALTQRFTDLFKAEVPISEERVSATNAPLGQAPADAMLPSSQGAPEPEVVKPPAAEKNRPTARLTRPSKRPRESQKLSPRSRPTSSLIRPSDPRKSRNTPLQRYQNNVNPTADTTSGRIRRDALEEIFKRWQNIKKDKGP